MTNAPIRARADGVLCKTQAIRGPFSGFGRAPLIIHPDYLKATKVTGTLFPNLGSGGKFYCEGEEKIAVYQIFPTGAIDLVYVNKQDSFVSKNLECDSLMAPFKSLCKAASDFSNGIASMDKKNLSDSQKFVILTELVSGDKCLRFKSELLKKLSRLQVSPLLRESAFDLPLSELQKQYACNQPIITAAADGIPYVRLVMAGETKAFAVAQLSTKNTVAGFEPLLPIEELASLPAADPCVAMARRIADIPEGKVEDQKKVLAKLNRLREFDALPTLDEYHAPNFSNDPRLVVIQGSGRASDRPLHTNGMMPCVGVAVMNKATKKAFLIHADGRTETDGLIDRLTAELGPGPLEAAIAGGTSNSGSRDTLYRILQGLDRNRIHVQGYRPNPGIDGLAVDPIAGIFY
jgi:hypothetical protein